MRATPSTRTDQSHDPVLHTSARGVSYTEIIGLLLFRGMSLPGITRRRMTAADRLHLIDQRGDRPFPTHRIRLRFDSSATNHMFNMLIARAAMAMMVTSEIVLSSIIINLAREVSGRTSVGLNAVEVQKARNR